MVSLLTAVPVEVGRAGAPKPTRTEPAPEGRLPGPLMGSTSPWPAAERSAPATISKDQEDEPAVKSGAVHSADVLGEVVEPAGTESRSEEVGSKPSVSDAIEMAVLVVAS